MGFLTAFVPFSLRSCTVDISGLGQCSVRGCPPAGGGVFPAETLGQFHGFVTANLVHEDAQAGLGGVIAHANAGQDGEHDDDDSGAHDAPAQGHYCSSGTKR